LFSNFSYTLYGLIVGGKPWTQALADHPELGLLADPERTRAVYGLAWSALVEHPGGLIAGSFKAWRDFLTPRGSGAFGFITPDPLASTTVESFVLRTLLYALSGLGVVQVWRERRDSSCLLLLALTIGVLA